jgi:hypothetical protein
MEIVPPLRLFIEADNDYPIKIKNLWFGVRNGERKERF